MVNDMENTIAAISTPKGSGGIGIIRVSGKDALSVADKIFKVKSEKNKPISDMKGYTACYGFVYDGDVCVDEAVALVYRAPHSYTGEDVVEISCHGGLYVTQRVLRAALNAGACTAQAGEFTKRAFLNGKMDLTQAQAVMDIISAKSESAVRSALSVRRGSLRKELDSVKNDIADITAHLDAWADYPDEDVPEVTSDKLIGSISSALSKLNKLISSYDCGKAVKEGIETAIVGKPNVGKSTLMNLLAGCERSIVTDIPGTTRDVVRETIVVGNVTLLLSDTAGIRNTDDPVEKLGVEKAKSNIDDCGLVIAVFDASKSLDENDMEMLSLIKDRPCIAVINKTDIKIDVDVEYISQYTSNIVYTSVSNGEGLEELTQAVEKVTGAEEFDDTSAVLSTERQRLCAAHSADSLSQALTAVQDGVTYDAVTVLLEDALLSILELTGESVIDVVVDKVFENFCVGK